MTAAIVSAVPMQIAPPAKPDPGGPKPETPRSPHWPAVEHAHLKLQPTCQVCGDKENLQVHHEKPFHLFPALELVDSNLITLCQPHHLLVGHLMRWAAWNPTVRQDVAAWRVKIAARKLA